MSWFQAEVRIGSYAWRFVHEDGEEGPAADGLTVLEGLTFGWSMRTSGVWPLQPEPMTCALTINAPHFPDLWNLAEGQNVTVRVKVDEDGPVVFPFYGRVTDLKANARKQRPGVFVSLIAVDPIVTELSQYEDYLYPAVDPDIPVESEDVLEALWSARGFGPFPLYQPGGSTLVLPPTSRMKPPDLIDSMLRQAASTGGEVDAVNRQIIAPWVEDGEEPVDGSPASWEWHSQPFVFDMVGKQVSWELNTDLDLVPRVIQGSKIDRASVKWVRNRNVPTRVEATGWGGVAENVAAADNGTLIPAVNVARFPVTLYEESRAEDVAELYLPDASAYGWTIESFTYHLSEEDPAVLAAFPVDFMPQWTYDDDDYLRSSCYRKGIQLAGLEDNVNPYGPPTDPDAPPGDSSGTITGVLAGCEVQIAGRDLFLDLKLRATLTEPPEAP